LDFDELFVCGVRREALEARDFGAREALAPFDDFAVLDLPAFAGLGLRLVPCPRPLEGRVFVSAMVPSRPTPVTCLKDAGTRDEKL